MSISLKDALSRIDLSTITLDGIPADDPQLAKALREVKDRVAGAVAHQQHGSHSDHSNAGDISQGTLKRPG